MSVTLTEFSYYCFFDIWTHFQNLVKMCLYVHALTYVNKIQYLHKVSVATHGPLLLLMSLKDFSLGVIKEMLCITSKQ